jgi:hypothetical protein
MAKAMMAGGPDRHQHDGSDWMQRRRQPGRDQRVRPLQCAKLDEASAHLCWPNQGGCGNRCGRARPGYFEQPGQMGRHRPGNEPGRGKHEGKKQHRPAWRRSGGPLHFGWPYGRRRARDQQPVQWQSDQEIQRRPDEASPAPAEMGFEQRRQRPAHCAGEPGDQGDPGDRTARRPAIETSKRSEGRIVETHRHPDAEDRPRGHKADNALRQRQEDQPGREDKIRQREHAAAAMSVYHPADRRTENGGDQQRAREDAEHDGA